MLRQAQTRRRDGLIQPLMPPMRFSLDGGIDNWTLTVTPQPPCYAGVRPTHRHPSAPPLCRRSPRRTSNSDGVPPCLLFSCEALRLWAERPYRRGVFCQRQGRLVAESDLSRADNLGR